jgi:hypothetical protein
VSSAAAAQIKEKLKGQGVVMGSFTGPPVVSTHEPGDNV